MDKHPNFFIIGAPKCGTTAMSEYLRTHPNVFMSNPKEPGFFAPDVVMLQFRYRTAGEYLALFATAQPQHKVIAEASTYYIRSDQASRRLAKFRPDARLLVMLRKPTDLVCSFHGELLKSGQENVWDFEKAWRLQSTRARGKAIPAGAIARELDYRWIGSLGSQVDRVLQLYPREQVHFILFDDFVRDPRREYVNLLKFLNLPDDGRLEFPRMNEAVQFKSKALARIARYLKAKTRPYLPSIKKSLGIRRRLGIIQAVDRLNAETRPRPPLRPEFRRYLDDVFREEVILLERLIGRDLSAWRN